MSDVRDASAEVVHSDPPPVLPEGLELVRPLGQGRMARVHLARNVELDRLEAVKILRRERATEEEPRLRFEGWVATVVKEGERFAWTPVPDGPRSTWRLRISFLEGGHT